ncbi:Gmad2 immunoglobulin-like domain-containing protein [Neobacillus vireti]|uniref:Gmad2 immunoglobulin-like domain-containing protein n=1 Tax=Neobacillus vireti TaxID=220686 RepID=UPI003000A43B
MSKKLWISVLMGLFLVLAACSLQPDTSQGEKEPNVVKEDDNLDKEPDVVNKEDNQDEESDGVEGENKQYGNEVFNEVTVLKTGDQVVVKGKARVFEGVFQYAVISGTEILRANHYQTDGAPAWGNFEITIEKELLAKDNVSMELFVYSAKDGSKTNILTIPIK